MENIEINSPDLDQFDYLATGPAMLPKLFREVSPVGQEALPATNSLHTSSLDDLYQMELNLL